MARLKNEVVAKIKEMGANGESLRAIIRATGASEKSISKLLGAETPKITQDDEELAVEESTDWKFWADYWKEEYLKLHAESKINEYLNS